MQEQLDKKLCSKYPKIFAQRHLPIDQTCMCWGFDCGDGWYELIDKLCAKIESICKLAKVSPPEASQVKEKYGTLRFYVGVVPDRPVGLADIIFDIIAAAENRSASVCEACGQFGEMNAEGWLSVKCSGCRKKEHEK